MNKLIWNAFAHEFEKVGAVNPLSLSGSFRKTPLALSWKDALQGLFRKTKAKPVPSKARSDMPGRFILPS